jgi:hypothetical protein
MAGSGRRRCDIIEPLLYLFIQNSSFHLLKYHCICIRIIFKGCSKMSPNYSVRKVGDSNTFQHRIYIEQNGVVISAFHDVPLYADPQQNTLNMVVEIPRWTNSKFEVSR